jgi:anti-sigma factor RsiW
MTKQTAYQKNICNGERLSQLVDGELTEAEKNQIEYHLTHCKNCRIELNRIRSLANTCQSMMDESRFQKDLAGLEGRIMSRIKRPKDWREIVWRFIRARKVLIPISAMGTILAILVTFQTFSTSPISPSAVITSMTGDFSSVIIMETPELHQTIIWIKENT